MIEIKLAKGADSVTPFVKGVEILPDGSVVRSGTNYSGKFQEAHDASKASIQSRISNLESGGVKGTGKVYPTRQIDSVTEAHIIDRVKELRGNLSSKYKKSGNFAVAEVDVSGISKSEFYAQSSINELKGSLEHKVPDISLQPENPMFKATEAVGKNGFNYLRNTDTEYKILNDIASRLGDNTQASGRIKLFTELDTCDSCNKVIAEFAAKYKNIELEVVHNNGNRIIP
ncbi:deaminase domain-containing protein [Bacillus sp. SBS7]|uniref:deaminase domain-containing protein n=1 Tax=Bacillus sp. SBS7 TaxID=3401756 RepID=UPI003AA82840